MQQKRPLQEGGASGLCVQVPAQSHDAIAALENVATMATPFLKHLASLRPAFGIRWKLARNVSTAKSEATASSCELLWADPWVTPHLNAQMFCLRPMYDDPHVASYPSSPDATPCEEWSVGSRRMVVLCLMVCRRARVRWLAGGLMLRP